MPDRPTPQEILQTPVTVSDPEITTLGQYLSRNLHIIWIGLRKSGVLPAGNGNWESVVVRALIKAGHLRGSIDSKYGNAIYTESEYMKLMDDAFELLESADYSTLALPPEPQDWYLLKLDRWGNLVDTESNPYTESDAQQQVEYYQNSYQNSANSYRWKAVHIPK